MKYYPSFGLEYIENELPMIKGRALINFAIERDGWLQFSGLRCLDGGYIEQEMKMLMKEINQQNDE